MWIDASHYLSSLYRANQSALTPCCYGCGNVLWESCSVQQTATPKHTWCISHTCQQPLLSPILCCHFHTTRHSNTDTHGSTLGHQTLLILSQGSQQRRTAWWIKAGIRGEGKTDAQKQALQDGFCSEQKLRRALLGKNHAKSDQSGLFYQMIMIKSFFLDKIRCILCALYSWLAYQLGEPKAFHTENL